MTTSNHEVVFAIVNAGYAQEAMDVAREQGARGGTIFNARGVTGAEAAAFFGITLHAEKEILMIVVEKDVRDAILNALYKLLCKKNQGIAFSLPVSDVAGLVPPQSQQEVTEA